MNTPAFSAKSHVRWIDPNNGPFTIADVHTIDPNTGRPESVRQIHWKPAQARPTEAKNEPPFSLEYDRSQFFWTSRVFVPIEMPRGRKYSAILDTGFTGQVYVNDLVVHDCDLAVFPLGANEATGCALGLCDIPSLQLGPLTISNPRCLYEQREWQLRVFNWPLFRAKIVLLGLGLMRGFSYVLFDNVEQQVVFSPHDAFEPNDPSKWVRLPFVTERKEDSLRMMTDLPLGDGAIHVQFDTAGAKPGLTLREAAWQRVEHSLQTYDNGPGACSSYQYGSLACHKYTIPKWTVDQIHLTGLQVDVLPDNSPLIQDAEGILSLDCFRDAVLVLDFNQNVIWIEQP